MIDLQIHTLKGDEYAKLQLNKEIHAYPLDLQEQALNTLADAGLYRSGDSAERFKALSTTLK